MTALTAAQLATLPEAVKTFPAAIYIPASRLLFACPNITAPLHQCPAAFTVPDAERLAATLRQAGSPAYVLVYGIPWTIR